MYKTAIKRITNIIAIKKELNNKPIAKTNGKNKANKILYFNFNTLIPLILSSDIFTNI